MKKPSFFILAMALSVTAHGAVGAVLLWEFSRSEGAPPHENRSVFWMRLNSPEKHPVLPEGCRAVPGIPCGQNDSREAKDTIREPQTEKPTSLEPAVERQDATVGPASAPNEVSAVIEDRPLEEVGPPEEESGPDPEDEGEKRQILDDFLRQVRLTIEKNKVYPWRARLAGMEGTVAVEFVLGENGKARRVRVVRSSGHPLLDDSAVGTIQQISRFPELPESLAKSEMDLMVPLVFRIEDRE